MMFQFEFEWSQRDETIISGPLANFSLKEIKSNSQVWSKDWDWAAVNQIALSVLLFRDKLTTANFQGFFIFEQKREKPKLSPLDTTFLARKTLAVWDIRSHVNHFRDPKKHKTF